MTGEKDGNTLVEQDGGQVPAGTGTSPETSEESGSAIPATTPSEGAPTSEGGGASIQELVAQAVAQVRAQYEKPDGVIARIQQVKDREVTELRRQLEEVQAANLRRAEQLMSSNPREAQALLQQEIQQTQMRRQVEAAGLQWRQWVEGQYEAAGMNPGEHAEAVEQAVAGLLDQSLQGQTRGFDAAVQFQTELFGKRLEEKDKAAKAAQDEVKQLRDSMPDLIKREVAKAMAASGLSPEPTAADGSGFSQVEDWRDWTPGQQVRYGIKEARRQMQKKR